MSDELQLILIFAVPIMAFIGAVNFNLFNKILSAIWLLIKWLGKAVLFIGVCIYWYTSSSDKYEAVVYPDRYSSYSIELGEFDSIEMCMDEADAYLHDRNLSHKGDYTCKEVN